MLQVFETHWTTGIQSALHSNSFVHHFYWQKSLVLLFFVVLARVRSSTTTGADLNEILASRCTGDKPALVQKNFTLLHFSIC